MTIATTVDFTLTVEEQSTFEEMIDASIIARYDSELERHDVFDGYFYMPLDTDRIRELLTKLRGDLFTAEAIEDAFARLTKDGAGEWPHGYCEEDQEREQQEQLELFDRGAEEKEEHEEHVRSTEAHSDFLLQLERWLWRNSYAVDHTLVSKT